MKFNRWKIDDDYSYAYKLFNKNHTFMNAMFWSYAPTYHYAQYNYRHGIKENPTLTTHEIFKINGLDSDRVITDSEEWSRNYKEFDNWNRLNTLVAVNSYFEIYLSSVVSLAIESDIGILHSISKEIDGIKVLKYNNINEYSFFDKSEEVTKGSWGTRISNYRKLFNHVPSELIKYEKELEKIRKLRNNIAHSFGQDIDISRARSTKYKVEIERLSLVRLQKYMAIIREVARGIDAHLLESHIGDFENLHYYHTIRTQIPENSHEKVFKKKLNSLYIKNKSMEYVIGLIEYYNQL